MKGLVESVKDNGVHQPALVRPREGGGYEIIAGHRRQRASELAGFANMPCIVRNMTDDEAILAMTDDNLRHREKILPMEKAQSLKMQVEAISHQGTKMEGVAAGDVGKRSTEIVGERNGMNYKQVQRYIRLTELVPELQSIQQGDKLIKRVEAGMLAPVLNIHNGARCAIHKLRQIVLCPALSFSFALDLPPQGVKVKALVILVHFHITLYYSTFRVRL